MGIDKQKKVPKWYYFLLIIIFTAVSIFLYFYKAKPYYTLTFESMNTYVSIAVFDKDSIKAQKATEEIFALFNKLNNMWNTYDSNSMLYKLNHYKFITEEYDSLLDSTITKSKLFKLDTMTYEVIKEAKLFNKTYDKRFNIAVGPLIHLWKKYAKLNKMPCDCTVKKIKRLYCNLDDIILDNQYNVKFANNNISIDFGALAKGFALKKSKEIMKKNGIKYYIINSGGDIYITSKFGFKYKVGITDPYNPQKVYKILKLKNCGVATSGDYERNFTIKGKKFTHIIDPETGYPSEEFNSATVICKDPFYADMWATTLSMGVSKTKKVEKNIKFFLINRDTTISYGF